MTAKFELKMAVNFELNNLASNIELPNPFYILIYSIEIKNVSD